MLESEAIAWVDGMLVKPHHFEQQERAVEKNARVGLGMFFNFAWGLLDFEINDDLLPLGKLQFRLLSGRFKDGTLFNLSNTELSELAFDVNEEFSDELIYLALPLNSNMSEKRESQYRYRIIESKATNTLHPGEPESSILVKRFNLQLLRKSSLTETHVAIPVAHVIEANPEGGLKLENNYIPPCLSSNKCPALKNEMERIVLLLTKKQKQLSSTIAAPLQSRQLTAGTDINILQIINESLVELKHKSQLGLLHPYDLFIYYSTLLAKVGTYYRHDRCAIETPNYAHEKLSPLFENIKSKISDILNAKFEHQANQLNLDKVEECVFKVSLHHLKNIKNHVLIFAIRQQSKSERDKICRTLKVSSSEDFNDIVNFHLPGLTLNHNSLVPPQLPYYNDATYLQVNKQENAWETIVRDKTLKIYIENASACDIHLWALPELDSTQL